MEKFGFFRAPIGEKTCSTVPVGCSERPNAAVSCPGRSWVRVWGRTWGQWGQKWVKKSIFQVPPKTPQNTPERDNNVFLACFGGVWWPVGGAGGVQNGPKTVKNQLFRNDPVWPGNDPPHTKTLFPGCFGGFWGLRGRGPENRIFGPKPSRAGFGVTYGRSKIVRFWSQDMETTQATRQLDQQGRI